MLQTQYVSSARRPRLLVAATAALLLTSVIAWGVLSRPADPAGDGADETTGPSGPEPPPLQTGAETESAAAAAAAAEMLESLTTVVPLAPLNPPTAPPTTEPPMPSFEAPFGSPDNAYVVLIGGPSRTIALDLLTGEMSLGPGGVDNPVLILDDYAVWRTDSTGLLGFSPLNDLGDVQPLDGLTSSSSVAAGMGSNTLTWIEADSATTVTVKEMSLDVDRITAETTIEGWLGSMQLDSGVEFISPAAGGVYRRSLTGYELVLADGAVVAHGQGLLLVIHCDERLRCEHAWYDTTNLQAQDLATPNEDQSLTGGRVLGSGWISVASRRGGSGTSDLLAIRTGVLVPDVAHLWSEHPVDVSSDDSVAVGALDDAVQLIDLMTGDRAVVTLPASLEMSPIHSVFLVPAGALGGSLDELTEIGSAG